MNLYKVIFFTTIITLVFSFSGKSQNQSNFNNSDSTIYIVVDSYPKFPGGEEKRIKFISKNLHYPIEAQEKNITGTVYVSFIVETDGKVSNVKLKNGIGGGCDEEAIRVIKLMPNWVPAKIGGNPVRVQMIMPIRFYIKENETNSQ